jgi:hypothetical protein
MNAIVNKFRKDPPVPKTEEEFVSAAPTGTVTDLPAPAKPHAAEKDQVYKSVTLRLTKDRYKALKMLSTTEEESIQDLLTQALDELLAKKA